MFCFIVYVFVLVEIGLLFYSFIQLIAQKYEEKKSTNGQTVRIKNKEMRREVKSTFLTSLDYVEKYVLFSSFTVFNFPIIRHEDESLTRHYSFAVVLLSDALYPGVMSAPLLFSD